MASFSLPSLPEQDQHWGPQKIDTSADSQPKIRFLPDEFRDIPFATFSKTERIGKIADWNSTSISGNPFTSNTAGGGDSSSKKLSSSSSSRRTDGIDPFNSRSSNQSSAYPSSSSTINNNTFAYIHQDDESTFSVVDNTKSHSSANNTNVKKSTGPSLGGMNRSNHPSSSTRGGGGGSAAGNKPGFNSTARGAAGGAVRTGQAMGGAQAVPNVRGGRGASRGGGISAGRGRGGARFGGRDWDKPQRIREASVAVGNDWKSLEEIDFTRLAKLRLDVDIDSVEELSEYGTLYDYDRSYDRISSIRFEKALVPQDRVRYNITTSEDPIITSIASTDSAQAPAPVEEGETPKTISNIYITDSILSVLMCSTRSVYPWDIIITKKDKSIFFDKRDGGSFDFITVNENAADPPLENNEIKEGETNKTAGTIAAQAKVAASLAGGIQNAINTPSALSLESTYINQNFAFQVVNEAKKTVLKDGENPFYNKEEENDPIASCGYRYRKFNLSSDDSTQVNLVVRTEVDAVLKPPGKDKGPKNYITVKTLNEFDSRAQGAGGAPDWRSKLDSQRGAVIATEMKNNSGKLARFAVQSILAGAESMKMGYISRANPRDTSRHSILGTQWYKPREFAAQMNLNLSNGWGIVRTVADLVRNSEEGMEKFVLVKDPNKPSIRLYSVPSTWPAEELDDAEPIDDQE